MMREPSEGAKAVAAVIDDAGGKLVGRTRLQKTLYLLELTGLGGGFNFGYHQYGPYADDVTRAVRNAEFTGLITEEEVKTDWGGFYSIFRKIGSLDGHNVTARQQIVKIAAEANAIALELAATAAYFAQAGYDDPWGETEERKTVKASDNRLDMAKALYQQLASVATPRRLPVMPQ